MELKCQNLKCSIVHDGSFGSGKYCSRKCANSRNWTSGDKLKKSQAAKSSVVVHEANTNPDKIKKLTKYNPINIKDCPICHKEFNAYNYGYVPKIYCSDKCCRLDSKEAGGYKKFSDGGYRPGSGRGKSGWHKGIWCDSSYELCFLVYCIDHHILIERCKSRYAYVDDAGNQRNYYPDFRVGDDNAIVEIKGYKEQYFDRKIAACDEDIAVYFRDDLNEHFEYVEMMYGKNFTTLYE